MMVSLYILPETEELVDRILCSRVLNELHAPHILDIGTGTGAIAISLLAALPNARCTALDINNHCIELASQNAASILGSNDALSRFKGVVHSFLDFAADRENWSSFDLIVSNPPYIPRKQLQDLQPEVKDFEDSVALDGGMSILFGDFLNHINTKHKH